MSTYNNVSNLVFEKNKIFITHTPQGSTTREDDEILTLNKWFKFYLEKNDETGHLDLIFEEVNSTNGAEDVFFNKFTDNLISINFSYVPKAGGGGNVWALYFDFIGTGDVRVGLAYDFNNTVHIFEEPQYIKLLDAGSTTPYKPRKFAYCCKLEKTFK